jgi:hypothetical protein
MFRACLALEQERDPKLDTARTPLLSLSFANLGMVFRRRERHDDAVPILKQSLQNLSKFPAQVIILPIFQFSLYGSPTLRVTIITTYVSMSYQSLAQLQVDPRIMCSIHRELALVHEVCTPLCFWTNNNAIIIT